MQSVESIIETTMAQLRSIVDVNTIVGEPVLSQKDILVVPVSKVSFGFFSGGGEYPPMGKVLKSAESVQKEGYPFLGTAVAGVSITPTIHPLKHSSTTISTMAMIANMVIVLPTMIRALGLSFAPTARAVRTVVPMASPMSTTVTIYITCAPFDTAVVLSTSQYCPMT